jgi:hypothetical protein
LFFGWLRDVQACLVCSEVGRVPLAQQRPPDGGCQPCRSSPGGLARGSLLVLLGAGDLLDDQLIGMAAGERGQRQVGYVGIYTRAPTGGNRGASRPGGRGLVARLVGQQMDVVPPAAGCFAVPDPDEVDTAELAHTPSMPPLRRHHQPQPPSHRRTLQRQNTPQITGQLLGSVQQRNEVVGVGQSVGTDG